LQDDLAVLWQTGKRKAALIIGDRRQDVESDRRVWLPGIPQRDAGLEADIRLWVLLGIDDAPDNPASRRQSAVWLTWVGGTGYPAAAKRERDRYLSMANSSDLAGL